MRVKRMIGSTSRSVRKSLKRIRHRKGFGVHSPYVYRIIREVFTKRVCDVQADRELFQELHRLSPKGKGQCAIEITNYIYDSKATTWAIDPSTCQGVEFAICTTLLSQTQLEKLIAEAQSSSTTIIILSPSNTLERELFCEGVVAEHRSTSIDRRGYLILINSSLPKQHFIV